MSLYLNPITKNYLPTLFYRVSVFFSLILTQVLDVLYMEFYNKYRERVSNDQILPLDISSSSSSDFEI